MSSYVDRGNKLIADAGLIVLVLRHLADEVERGSLGAKELYKGMQHIRSSIHLGKVCMRLTNCWRVKKGGNDG